MLRSSRSTSMGLLDGLQSLQGPPPPNPHSHRHPQTHPQVQTSSSGSTLPPPDPLSQFSAGAKSFFSGFGSKLSDTFAPAVDNINDTAKSSVTSLRRLMGDETVNDIEAPPQMTLSEEMSTMFNLTMFQRILLFAMCFGTGILLIGLSFTFLPIVVIAPHKFAASFTMGNILAIVSTWILVGPRAQLQSMFNPIRAVASSVYLVSLVLSLLAAFFGGKLRYILVLITLFAEIAARKSPHFSSLQRPLQYNLGLAMFHRLTSRLPLFSFLFPFFLVCWYALSYIPYGRQMISRMFSFFTG